MKKEAKLRIRTDKQGRAYIMVGKKKYIIAKTKEAVKNVSATMIEKLLREFKTDRKRRGVLSRGSRAPRSTKREDDAKLIAERAITADLRKQLKALIDKPTDKTKDEISAGHNKRLRKLLKPALLSEAKERGLLIGPKDTKEVIIAKIMKALDLENKPDIIAHVAEVNEIKAQDTQEVKDEIEKIIPSAINAIIKDNPTSLRRQVKIKSELKKELSDAKTQDELEKITLKFIEKNIELLKAEKEFERRRTIINEAINEAVVNITTLSTPGIRRIKIATFNKLKTAENFDDELAEIIRRIIPAVEPRIADDGDEAKDDDDDTTSLGIPSSLRGHSARSPSARSTASSAETYHSARDTTLIDRGESTTPIATPAIQRAIEVSPNVAPVVTPAEVTSVQEPEIIPPTLSAEARTFVPLIPEETAEPSSRNRQVPDIMPTVGRMTRTEIDRLQAEKLEREKLEREKLERDELEREKLERKKLRTEKKEKKIREKIRILEEEKEPELRRVYNSFKNATNINVNATARKLRDDAEHELNKLITKIEDLKDVLAGLSSASGIDFTLLEMLQGKGEDIEQEEMDNTDVLRGSQINNMMEKHDGWRGVCFMDDMAEKLGQFPDEDVSMVIANTLPSDAKEGDIGHYIAVMINHDEEVIMFMDPLAIDPTIEIMKQLTNLMESTPNEYQLKINTVQQQDVQSQNCGFHCMLFLNRIIAGDKFADATYFSKIDNTESGENDAKKFKLNKKVDFEMI